MLSEADNLISQKYLDLVFKKVSIYNRNLSFALNEGKEFAPDILFNNNEKQAISDFGKVLRLLLTESLILNNQISEDLLKEFGLYDSSLSYALNEGFLDGLKNKASQVVGKTKEKINQGIQKVKDISQNILAKLSQWNELKWNAFILKIDNPKIKKLLEAIKKIISFAVGSVKDFIAKLMNFFEPMSKHGLREILFTMNLLGKNAVSQQEDAETDKAVGLLNESEDTLSIPSICYEMKDNEKMYFECICLKVAKFRQEREVTNAVNEGAFSTAKDFLFYNEYKDKRLSWKANIIVGAIALVVTALLPYILSTMGIATLGTTILFNGIAVLWSMRNVISLCAKRKRTLKPGLKFLYKNARNTKLDWPFILSVVVTGSFTVLSVLKAWNNISSFLPKTDIDSVKHTSEAIESFKKEFPNVAEKNGAYRIDGDPETIKKWLDNNPQYKDVFTLTDLTNTIQDSSFKSEAIGTWLENIKGHMEGVNATDFTNALVDKAASGEIAAVDGMSHVLALNVQHPGGIEDILANNQDFTALLDKFGLNPEKASDYVKYATAVSSNAAGKTYEGIIMVNGDIDTKAADAINDFLKKSFANGDCKEILFKKGITNTMTSRIEAFSKVASSVANFFGGLVIDFTNDDYGFAVLADGSDLLPNKGKRFFNVTNIREHTIEEIQELDKNFKPDEKIKKAMRDKKLYTTIYGIPIPDMRDDVEDKDKKNGSFDAFSYMNSEVPVKQIRKIVKDNRKGATALLFIDPLTLTIHDINLTREGEKKTYTVKGLLDLLSVKPIHSDLESTSKYIENMFVEPIRDCIAMFIAVDNGLHFLKTDKGNYLIKEGVDGEENILGSNLTYKDVEQIYNGNLDVANLLRSTAGNKSVNDIESLEADKVPFLKKLDITKNKIYQLTDLSKESREDNEILNPYYNKLMDLLDGDYKEFAKFVQVDENDPDTWPGFLKDKTNGIEKDEEKIKAANKFLDEIGIDWSDLISINTAKFKEAFKYKNGNEIDNEDFISKLFTSQLNSDKDIKNDWNVGFNAKKNLEGFVSAIAHILSFIDPEEKSKEDKSEDSSKEDKPLNAIENQDPKDYKDLSEEEYIKKYDNDIKSKFIEYFFRDLSDDRYKRLLSVFLKYDVNEIDKNHVENLKNSSKKALREVGGLKNLNERKYTDEEILGNFIPGVISDIGNWLKENYPYFLIKYLDFKPDFLLSFLKRIIKDIQNYEKELSQNSVLSLDSVEKTDKEKELTSDIKVDSTLGSQSASFIQKLCWKKAKDQEKGNEVLKKWYEQFLISSLKDESNEKSRCGFLAGIYNTLHHFYKLEKKPSTVEYSLRGIELSEKEGDKSTLYELGSKMLKSELYNKSKKRVKEYANLYNSSFKTRKAAAKDNNIEDYNSDGFIWSLSSQEKEFLNSFVDWIEGLMNGDKQNILLLRQKNKEKSSEEKSSEEFGLSTRKNEIESKTSNKIMNNSSKIDFKNASNDFINFVSKDEDNDMKNILLFLENNPDLSKNTVIDDKGIRKFLQGIKDVININKFEKTSQLLEREKDTKYNAMFNLGKLIGNYIKLKHKELDKNFLRYIVGLIESLNSNKTLENLNGIKEFITTLISSLIKIKSSSQQNQETLQSEKTEQKRSNKEKNSIINSWIEDYKNNNNLNNNNININVDLDKIKDDDIENNFNDFFKNNIKAANLYEDKNTKKGSSLISLLRNDINKLIKDNKELKSGLNKIKDFEDALKIDFIKNLIQALKGNKKGNKKDNKNDKKKGKKSKVNLNESLNAKRNSIYKDFMKVISKEVVKYINEHYYEEQYIPGVDFDSYFDTPVEDIDPEYDELYFKERNIEDIDSLFGLQEFYNEYAKLKKSGFNDFLIVDTTDKTREEIRDYKRYINQRFTRFVVIKDIVSSDNKTRTLVVFVRNNSNGSLIKGLIRYSSDNGFFIKNIEKLRKKYFV